ncbi:MAG: DUF4922 domain-containing protein [Deltaproteobacteria bacterium]|nr:DUF4922 domain-containing protein [Deltaproteobacteria bacterium]
MSDPWAGRLVIPGAPDGPPAGTTLAETLEGFLGWQAARWPRLARARDALAGVRVWEVPVGRPACRVQWNPDRTLSTTARVDPASVAARPCFLCPGALPEEERGLAFGADAVILANPAPILPDHLVFVARAHVPQAVGAALPLLLAVAATLGGRFSAFYNGPRCGASAPDHLHVQAVRGGVLPAERAAVDGPGPDDRLLVVRPDLTAWSLQGQGRPALAFQGRADRVASALGVAVETLGQLRPDAPEPLLNLLAVGRPQGVLALLFPRAAHRPACFFDEGPARLTVSPGALDMAGEIVAVREEDFQALDGSRVASIFSEVSLDPGRVRALEDALARRLYDG